MHHTNFKQWNTWNQFEEMRGKNNGHLDVPKVPHLEKGDLFGQILNKSANKGSKLNEIHSIHLIRTMESRKKMFLIDKIPLP